MAGQKNTANGAATPSADTKLINSNTIIRQAQDKIKPSNEKKLGRYEKAVNSAVAKVLKEFCEQSEEFARAIVETDKTYDDCLQTICKGLGQSISDFDLYTKAGQFWSPGAIIEDKMKIRMSEYEAEEETEKPEPKPQDISLSLDSLLDW